MINSLEQVLTLLHQQRPGPESPSSVLSIDHFSKENESQSKAIIQDSSY